ncbi:hypothetical protein M427DRAFT_51050, partial [Gonapodya prolifera JEL478]
MNLGQFASRNPFAVESETFEDETAFLRQAAQELEIGQLVHSPFFTLGEAMAAVEIMDPKMDIGMRSIDSTPAPAPAPSSLSLLPLELVRAMDVLVAREMTYLSGHHPHHTLIPSILLHRPSALPQPVVSLFCTALLRTAHLARNAIIKAGVAAEEDFVPVEIGAGDAGARRDGGAPDGAEFDPDLADRMKRAEDDLERDGFLAEKGMPIDNGSGHGRASGESRKDGKGGNNGKSGSRKGNGATRERAASASSSGTPPASTSSPDPIARSAASRLRLRRLYLLSLHHLCSQPPVKHLPLAKKHLAASLASIRAVRSELTAEAAHSDGTNEGRPEVDVSRFFDATSAKKLTSGAPSRSITVMGVDEAYRDFETMLAHLLELCDFLQQGTLTGLMTHTTLFAAKQPSPSILVRSIQYTVTLPAPSNYRLFDRIPTSQLVRESIEGFCRLTYFYDTRPQPVARIADAFLAQAVEPVLLTLKALCFNRARQRRLLHKCVEAFEVCQAEAETLDGELHGLMVTHGMMKKNLDTYFLSSWVYHHKMRLLETLLSMGFELELYSPYEYVMIFWYLLSIFDAHNNHLRRVELMSTTRERASTRPAPGKAGGKAKNLAKEQASLNMVEILILTAMTDFVRAHMQLAAALMNLGMIHKPQADFDDEGVRYAHRFKLFARLGSPRIATYEEFLSDCEEMGAVVPELLLRSAQHFQAARSMMEHLASLPPSTTRTELCHEDFTKEYKGLARNCAANMVVAKVMQTVGEGGVGDRKVLPQLGPGGYPVWSFVKR